MRKLTAVKRPMGDRGSTLLMVLVALGLIGLTAMAAMSLTDSSNKAAANLRLLGNANALSEAAITILSSPTLCKDGVDGAGPLPGLRFYNSATNDYTFDSAVATAGSSGQSIELGTNLLNSAGQRIVLKDGVSLAAFDLKLEKLSIVATTTSTPDSYKGDLIAQVSSLSQFKLPISPKKIASVTFAVDPVTKLITSCSTDGSNLTSQELCLSMGCAYDPTSTTQKCTCPLPTVSCPTGTYLASIDPVTNAPDCRGVSISCPGGQFMSGIDTSGQPICVTVSKCPGGSSLTGLGAAVPSTSCRCPNATDTWNGSACVSTIIGSCGPANGNSFPDAATATAAGLCAAGTPSTVLAGAGPWNWNCMDSSGAGFASCTASSGPPIAGTCTYNSHSSVSYVGNSYSYQFKNVSPASCAALGADFITPPPGMTCTGTKVGCSGAPIFAGKYSFTCSDGSTFVWTDNSTGYTGSCAGAPATETLGGGVPSWIPASCVGGSWTSAAYCDYSSWTNAGASSGIGWCTCH